MYFQLLGGGFSRDTILLMRFLGLIIIFFMALKVGKRVRDIGIFSTATGFTIFLITLGLFHFLIALPNLSNEILPSFYYYTTINTIFLMGMFFFIFFTELDNYLHSSYQNNGKRFFPLSTIAAVGGTILGILALFLIISVVFVFFFVVIPLVISTDLFLRPYKSFEIIKRSKTKELFFLGISLSGLSNFLIMDFFFSLFGYWIVFFINTLLIISGGILMTWTWNKLPSLSELNWMLKLERLLVVHLESSKLMYNYDFQISAESPSIVNLEGDLVSSAIGGVNIVLKEILASNGYIKEINHGDKSIIFSHGVATVVILITSGHSSEFKYRLKMFHLSFEKQFGGDKLKDWKGNLKIFEKTYHLVNRFFSQ